MDFHQRTYEQMSLQIRKIIYKLNKQKFTNMSNYDKLRLTW